MLTLGIGGTVGVLAAALALGIRHGIDWDHIAAITDITSTTAAAQDTEERWLTGEPGVMLTDESHHSLADGGRLPPVAGGSSQAWVLPAFLTEQRQALFLGTMYALGHGTIVTILGVVAILASGFLPDWIDPIMERVVGVTLILLAAYLFYSLYRFFRGGGEFRIRSRWMLIFAGVRKGFNWLRARVSGEHPHQHDAHGTDQYGVRTAYSVGLIHGIGAETGTQVLVIATAVGAGTKLMGIAVLMVFVTGLLISNSFITFATAAGFVSSRRRQGIYVFAGLLAAVFSLVVGIVFLFRAGGFLPDLDPYFRWIGGPN
jgi:high-affinity nickel-transport protein